MPGEPPLTDDGIACTVGTCNEEADQVDHIPDSDFCSDDDVCNGNETCQPDLGDPVTGCLAATPIEYDDGVACTVDSCDPLAGPVNLPDNSICNDSNPCTADTCDVENGCVHEPLAGMQDDVPCCLAQNEECDDGNECTVKVCDQELHQCQVTDADDGNGCEDGLTCTIEDSCQSGQCVGTPDACDDQVDCTLDSCEEPGGCLHVVDDSLCDDGSVCTGVEMCSADSGCQPGESLVCDDGVDCTVDSCDDQAGCDSIVDDALCDDDNPCTVDGCSEDIGCIHLYGGGVHGDVVCCKEQASACDDANECTDDLCHEDSSQCANTPVDDGTPCEDGLSCTADDSCTDGLCLGLVEGCDDQVGCTVDACEEPDGCTHVPDDSVCDDDDLCTGDEVCDPVTGCKSPEPLDCNDDIACTADDCDAQQGCLHEVDHVLCDDEVLCTVDTCVLALGCEHSAADQACNDGNECTAEFCDADNGCQYENLDGVDCNDSDDATVDDVCSEGACNGLPDPDADGIANEGYLQPCTGGEMEACNDNCPDVPNGDQADADGNGVGDVCDGDWLELELDLYEPCADVSPAFKDGLCTPGQPAYQDLSSSWQRTDEPFELPLVNGIIDDSVVGYWKFDGNLQDSGPQGNHGTNSSAEASDAGKFDGAWKFSAASDYVAIDSTTDLYLKRYSVLLWADLSDCPNDRVLMAKGGAGSDPNDHNFYVRITGSGKLMVAHENNNSWTEILAEVTPGAKNWRHIGATYDGTALSLYLDGQLLGRTVGPEPGELNPNPITIGASAEHAHGFVGLIDEVLVLNRALSPAEIAAYCGSSKPYGYNLAPEAQADFDDIRVNETAAGEAAAEVIHEIIGPRPHSDTPCTMDEDDGTWAHRDDLCGVIGYWRLDGNGVDVLDSHDGAENATSTGTGRFGDADGAVSFDGASTTVIIPSADFVQTKATWELWINPAECGENQYVVHNSQSGHHNDLNLNLPPSCHFGLTADGESGNEPTVIAKDPAALMRWTHLAVTFNGQFMKLYVDGLLHDTQAYSDPVGTSGVPIKLGCGGGCFTGKIDEFIIHSVAKSPDYVYRRANPDLPSVRFLVDTEEQPDDDTYPYKTYELTWGDQEAKHQVPLVEDTHNVNGGQPCVGLLSPCNGYAGWWRFNEGSGAVAVDSSTNKNNGSSNSANWVGGGPDGVACSFTGSASQFVVPHSSSLAPESVSIEFLGNHSSLTPGATSLIVFKGNFPSNEGYYITATPSSGYYFAINDDDYRHYTNHVPVFDTWEAVAATFDQPSAVTTFLLDFSLHSTQDGGPAVKYSNADLFLGQLASASSAIVDSVRIMNRALAPDEFLHHPMTQAWGLLYQCAPLCAGKECGDDGCGGSCGECAGGADCVDGLCTLPGVWIDPVTGLFWMNPADEDIKWMSWGPNDDPEKHCNSLDYAGFNDWRLPSIHELRSLIRGCASTVLEGPCEVDDDCMHDACANPPCAANDCPSGGGPGIDGMYWPEELVGPCCAYWSSSTAPGIDDKYWHINFNDANIELHINNNEGVRCVRDP